MCTGLYQFEGTRVFTTRKKTFNASVGVDPVTIGALAGAPVGGSIQISPDTSLETGSASEERLVWAAQWRKVKARYMRSEDVEEATLSNVLSLYVDVTSSGILRDDDGDDEDDQEPYAVQIELDADGDGGSQDTQGDEVVDKTYDEKLAEAITEFEDFFPEEKKINKKRGEN